MIGLGLRQVQQAVDSKADAIQREFIAVGDELDELGRQLLEASSKVREQLREKQRLLRDRQRDLAAEVNQWRDRARGVRSQPGEHTLREYLSDRVPQATQDPAAARRQTMRLFPSHNKYTIEDWRWLLGECGFDVVADGAPRAQFHAFVATAG